MMNIHSLTNLFEQAGLEIEFTRLAAGIAQHQYVLVLRSNTLAQACYYKSKILNGISAFNAQEMTLVFLMGQLHRHSGMARLIRHHFDEQTHAHVTTFCEGYRRFLVGADTRKVVAKIINDELAMAQNDDQKPMRGDVYSAGLHLHSRRA